MNESTRDNLCDIKINENNSDDDSINTTESDDTCMQMICFESIRSPDDHIEEAIVLSWPKNFSNQNDNDDDDNNNNDYNKKDTEVERYKTLHISTLLDPDDLAPLFSGAEWAGTRVWHAAIRAIQYLDKHYSQQIQSGATLLELGCGLGVPGMVAYQMGANVVLTDQESIMSQLNKNIESNFSSSTAENNDTTNIIQAKPLSWSRSAIQNLLSSLSTQQIQKFDFILNCDCVYEPLYGDSWKLLVEVLDDLFASNPNAISLTSVERRAFDGIDDFLSTLNQCKHVHETNKVYIDEKHHIELYITTGKPSTQPVK